MAEYKQFSRRFTVQQRLWTVAAACLLTFILFGLYNLTTVLRLGGFVNEVVNVHAPLTRNSVDLKTQLQSSSSAMGLYLLSLDQEHRTKFEASFQNVKSLLKALKALKQDTVEHGIVLDGMQQVEDLLAQTEGVFNDLLEIARNPQANVPAQGYAAEKLNPISTRIIDHIDGLLREPLEVDDPEQARALLLTLADMRFTWARITAELRSYLAFRNAEVATGTQIYLDRAESLAAEIAAASDFLPFEYQEFALAIVDDVAAFRLHMIELIELHGARYWKRDVQLVATRLVPLLTRLEAGIDTLVLALQRKMQAKSQDTVELVSGTESFNTILLPILTILGGLVTWLFIRSIVCPLQSAVAAMKDIAEGSGNLNQKLDDSGRDELSQLGQGFNGFVTKIRGLVELAVGSASSLASESGRLNEATRRSQDQVEHQQRDINEISLAVNELSESAGSSSEKAGAAAAAAEQAHCHAREGQAVVQEALGAIRDLAGEVRDASEVIAQLETESGRIGTVLSVIRTISEQTNLLALNAAIEAARAGEHGRGFAVVADEVRTLSEKIHSETDNVQTIITGLQESSQRAVSAIARGNQHSGEVMDHADKAGTALSAITDSVATITDMNSGIADIAETQRARANDIRQKTDSLQRIAEEASGTAQVAAASSNEFTIMASQLQDLVQQFLVAPEDATDHGTVDDTEFFNAPAAAPAPASGAATPTARPAAPAAAAPATAPAAQDDDNVTLF